MGKLRTKHTPGPWTAKFEPNYGMWSIYWPLSQVPLAQHLIENNARLIAEAPAMADLLRRLVRCEMHYSDIADTSREILARIDGENQS